MQNTETESPARIETTALRIQLGFPQKIRKRLL